MSRSIEQSFKSRMRTIALERRVVARELWEILALERLLVRVALSRHAEKFVLKGGMLLAKYLDLGRHTQDLDFLVRRRSDESLSLAETLGEIMTVPVKDGFEFFDLSVKPLSHPHMRYPGNRAVLRSTFGKTRFKVIVDVGYGDVVEPVAYALPLFGHP